MRADSRCCRVPAAAAEQTPSSLLWCSRPTGSRDAHPPACMASTLLRSHSPPETTAGSPPPTCAAALDLALPALEAPLVIEAAAIAQSVRRSFDARLAPVIGGTAAAAAAPARLAEVFVGLQGEIRERNRNLWAKRVARVDQAAAKSMGDRSCWADLTSYKVPSGTCSDTRLSLYIFSSLCVRHTRSATPPYAAGLSQVPLAHFFSPSPQPLGALWSACGKSALSSPARLRGGPHSR